MIDLPETVLNAQKAFNSLQGVGEKSALRMVMGMTKWKREEITFFSKATQALSALKNCQRCGFFSDEELCSVCQDPIRNTTGQLCVVESITDLLAIERSSFFRGLYIVLGGVLNPLMGVGPDELRFKELLMQVEQGSIQEVVLALNPSVEGDATCSYIKRILPEHIKVDRIGFGVPIGGSLEYLDAQTIGKALENRKNY